MKLNSQLAFDSGTGDFVRLQAIELNEHGSEGTGLLSLKSGSFACENYPFYFDNLAAFLNNVAVLHRDLKGTARLAFSYTKAISFS